MPNQKINTKKMISKGVIGLFIGIPFGLVGILIGVFLKIPIWPSFFVTWVLTIFLFGLWGAKSKTDEEKRAELQRTIISEEGLIKSEKNVAWIFCIINPVITGGVMYYIWHRKYPTKAREANRISIIVFTIEIILFFVVKLILIK